MSKLYAVAILVALAVACSKADETDEEKAERAKEMFRSMAQECKKSEGATDDDVEALIDDQMPETQVQKCFHSCLQQQFGISDGKVFLKEGFMQVSAMVYQKDEDKLKLIEEVAEECDGTANEDSCELSVDIMTCVKAGMEKRGLKES